MYLIDQEITNDELVLPNDIFSGQTHHGIDIFSFCFNFLKQNEKLFC